jgi:hypothetical protein
LKTGLFGVLKHPSISKREVIIKTDNDVIQTANPENISRLRESLSAFPVFPAWGGISRRMIMQKQNSGTAISNCRGKYFSRTGNRVRSPV